MKIQLNPLFSAIATTLAWMVSPASATPLASDDISYPTGNIENQSGGFGWSGGYAVGTSEGFLNDVRDANTLSYPNYAGVGGTYANVAAGYGFGTFNYIQRTVDVTGAFAAFSDGVRVGADDTTVWGSFVYHKVVGMEFYLQGETNAPFSLPTTGADSLFLYRIQFGAGNADTITIWNNPDLTTWTPSATPTSTFTGNYSFQTLVFVAPNNENEGRFDNIRLGSEAIDVVPYSATTTPYVTWALSKSLDPLTDGAPAFDKDNDDASNLEEYAFFTDPKSGSSLPSMVTATNATNVTLTYLRANGATDVTYIPEVSTDLGIWTSVGLTDVPTGLSTVDTTEYVITAVKAPDPAKFLRIRVTLPVAP